jgi:DNA-binding transcriptional LysR family regulator
MDHRQLVSFVRLAEELHFVQAAKRLRITQSALSQQIAKLEARLGLRLFDRSRRRVALTEAGKIFLEEARKVIRQIDTAETLARRAAQGQIGRLTVAYVEAAPFNILSPIVLAFRRACPEVHLDLVEMITSEQIEALSRGRIEVGLMRPMSDDPALSSVLLQREPYVLAMPESHPLAGAGKVRMSALRDEAFIMTSPAKAQYIEDRFRALFSRHGFRPRIVQEVNQVHAVIGLVGGGLGGALVPRSVSKLKLDGVVFKPLQDHDAPKAEMVAVWRKQDDAPVVKRFVDLARAHAVSARR